jgi:hypothetical protein
VRLISLLTAGAAGFFFGRFLRAGDLEAEQQFLHPEQLALRLDIGDGNGFGLWRRTHSVASAGPDERGFELDSTSGELVFGDGAHGASPPPTVEVRAAYRTGGGSAGHVP